MPQNMAKVRDRTSVNTTTLLCFFMLFSSSFCYMFVFSANGSYHSDLPLNWSSDYKWRSELRMSDVADFWDSAAKRLWSQVSWCRRNRQHQSRGQRQKSWFIPPKIIIFRFRNQKKRSIYSNIDHKSCQYDQLFNL